MYGRGALPRVRDAYFPCTVAHAVDPHALRPDTRSCPRMRVAERLDACPCPTMPAIMHNCLCLEGIGEMPSHPCPARESFPGQAVRELGHPTSHPDPMPCPLLPLTLCTDSRVVP